MFSRQAKFLGKLIPECMTERAVVDLQRGRGRWVRGLQMKNECYDGAKQRKDYIDIKVEWW